MLHRAPRKSTMFILALLVLVVVSTGLSVAVPSRAGADEPVEEQPRELVVTADHEETVPRIDAPYHLRVSTEVDLRSLAGRAWRLYTVGEDGDLDTLLRHGKSMVLPMTDPRHGYVEVDHRGLAYGSTYAYTFAPRGRTPEGETVDGAVVTLPFVFDGHAQIAARPLDRSFLPYRDGERDSARVRVIFGEPIESVTARLKGPGGRYVHAKLVKMRARSAIFKSVAWSRWGKAQRGLLQWNVTAFDRNGDRGTATAYVRALPDRLVWAWWTRRAEARSSVIDSGVGSCSDLRYQRTSVRYLSATRCSKPRQSQVSTVSAVRLPKSGAKGFRELSIKVKGKPERPDAYLVMFLIDRAGEYRNRVQLGGGWGHDRALRSRGLGDFVRTDDTSPYLLWSAGLSEGSRYRVDEFIVKVRRQVLVRAG